jgi:tryptophan 2,3-dioxygenase
LYWQAAGKEYSTGKKIVSLEEFERKYKTTLNHMEEYNTINIWQNKLQM